MLQQNDFRIFLNLETEFTEVIFKHLFLDAYFKNLHSFKLDYKVISTMFNFQERLCEYCV